ncbi:MAG: acyl-CoA dehydrogenase [Acidimicrobiia bacterium]|nr:acyl-CoA dehydrogenase [Acidimicrobiia bacterium]
MPYSPPLRDIDFALNHVANLKEISQLEGYGHADPETISDLLEEAGRFFSEVIAPLNRSGDIEGSRLVDGKVVTPEGFKDAYSKFVEAGWPGAHMSEEWGGGGLPYLVGLVIQEFSKSANMAFSLCPMLTQGGIEALIELGTTEQHDTFLEKLVTGEWTGTMDLTEPEAGSDVGALRTRAEPQEDGTYRLFGQKIFITWGDQDFTENVVHLVLARTPDSPPGTTGISMFIVPRNLVDEDGNPGEENDLRVVSLEHKLGIHASPTCVMSFGDRGDGALGYVLGGEGDGMKNMFIMMNAARIGVGIEGLAIGEGAYQKALQFTRERKQGRLPGQPATESVAIIEHPDVRRMLLTMKSYNEAMRRLLYVVAQGVDLERHDPDESTRRAAGQRVALLTPIAKAWCTDLGVEQASLGIQIHGGMGYIEETGAAQYFRDSRIAPIYEGTNGIQAIDLLMRKLPMGNGAVMTALCDEIAATIKELQGHTDLNATRLNMEDGLEALRLGTEHLLSVMGNHPSQALAGATPYLGLAGNVIGGWLMARSALVAKDLIESNGPDAWMASKITTGRFYCEQLMPKAFGLLDGVRGGDELLFAIPTDSLD